MRTLKFRAWDIEAEDWVDDPSNIYEHICEYEESETLDSDMNRKWVIEQYTGLKDKNGKEIYEGDIVKTNSPDRANFNAGAIVMQQQMYLVINTPTYDDARLSHSEPLGYYCDMECEVIGNIHENPELLGE